MKYFGTDGIRGVVDREITAELAYKIGLAIGASINDNNLPRKVIIGKDTRISNDLICYALSSGLMNCGVDSYMLDIVPTACVSYLMTKLSFGYGVMITASHNSWEMNGIKLFNSLGYKCNKEEEERIEDYIGLNINKSNKKGKIINARKYLKIYIKNILKEINTNFNGLNIALDLSNGANYKIAPYIYKKLGANIIPINNKNDGTNINNNCGAEYIEKVREEVFSHSCDFGFAFDGDADRLRVVLKNGLVLDGDDILFIFANYLKKTNQLNSLTVVGTIMSNTGLENSLNKLGISLIRTDVGDKNVIEVLKSKRYSLGGESSGHICLHEYNTTCDALFTSLFFLKIVKSYKFNVEECLLNLHKLPQLTTSITVSDEFRNKYNTDKSFKKVLEEKTSVFCENAKLIIRPSGTESVFRITIESMSDDKNKYIRNNTLNIINEIEREIEKEKKC